MFIMNLNNIVFVKLTERGKKIYKDHNSETDQYIRENFPKITIVKDQKNLDVEISFQLWKLFSIFGKYINIGLDPVFVNNEIIFKNKGDK